LYDEVTGCPRNVELEDWVYGNFQMTKLFISRLITSVGNAAQWQDLNERRKRLHDKSFLLFAYTVAIF
jgi:hypothetical protein